MAKYRFLIVDDSLLIREFIKGAINEMFTDADTFEAANGKEAQKKMENSRFDLILCDWEMPEFSGSQLLQWIRENPETKAMPFIMVTAKREKEAVLEAIKLGVTDYVVKPLTVDVLCQKISTTLKKAGK